MATAPAPQLPVLFNDLVPLSSEEHADWRLALQDRAPFLSGIHAVPVTVDEFVAAQHTYPIVFSANEEPVPIALFGLNEGVNVFTDADGRFERREDYVPAYIRRYPFMLARLRPDSEQLSLCVDPTFEGVKQGGEEGQPLFNGTEPSEVTRSVLDFCQQYEESAGRTAAFMAELAQAKLLMDGEVTIEVPGHDPFVYRGFRMVDEKKLREMRGDQLRKWNSNGVLGIIYAHLFSLPLMSQVFNRQANSGRVPGLPTPDAAAGDLTSPSSNGSSPK